MVFSVLRVVVVSLHPNNMSIGLLIMSPHQAISEVISIVGYCRKLDGPAGVFGSDESLGPWFIYCGWT